MTETQVYIIGLTAILLLVAFFIMYTKIKKIEQEKKPEWTIIKAPVENIDILLGLFEYAVISDNAELKEYVREEIKKL